MAKKINLNNIEALAKKNAEAAHKRQQQAIEEARKRREQKVEKRTVKIDPFLAFVISNFILNK